MKLTQEFQEGLLSGLAGLEIHDCPYEYPQIGASVNRDEWERGWKIGALYYNTLNYYTDSLVRDKNVIIVP